MRESGRRRAGRRRDRDLQPRGAAEHRSPVRAEGSERHGRVHEDDWVISFQLPVASRATGELAGGVGLPVGKRTGPGGPPGLQNRLVPALRAGWVRLPGASCEPSLTLADASASYGWQAMRRLSTVARSAEVDRDHSQGYSPSPATYAANFGRSKSTRLISCWVVSPAFGDGFIVAAWEGRSSGCRLVRARDGNQ